MLNKGETMRKITIFFNLTLAIFCLASLTALAVAAEKQKPAQAPATRMVPANSITQAAMKNGVKSCAGRINQVTNFITAGAKDTRYLMSISPKKPDQQMSSVSMEIPLKNASSAYATASFSPDQANSCTGMYETVVYWPQNCTEVGENIYGKYKNGGKLSNNIYVRDGGGSTKVFLMPAGKGCVSIKKEVVR